MVPNRVKPGMFLAIETTRRDVIPWSLNRMCQAIKIIVKIIYGALFWGGEDSCFRDNHNFSQKWEQVEEILPSQYTTQGPILEKKSESILIKRFDFQKK